MSFSKNFLASFNERERESALVNIIAVQGDNADLAIAEDLNRELLQSTELIKFPVYRLRSWLSFLLKDISNVTSASGVVTCKLTESTAPVSIPAGTLLSTVNGVIYQMVNSVYILPGGTVSLSVVQGESTESEGIYSEFIVIPSANVDVSRLRVYINGIEVKKCEIFNEYANPYNGWFSFYSGDNLYIKVFTGPDVGDPEGSTYRVSVWTSNGKFGNTQADTFESFVGSITDENGQPVKFELSNPDILNGANAPTRADLVAQLRYWFFVKTSVSSVPEYTAWFKSQPEIGDVIVEGDFEKWRKQKTKEVVITGKVFVSALGRDGKPISSDVKNTLSERILPYKDIGYVEWTDPEEVKCFIAVGYQSSFNNVEFNNLLRQTLNNYFSLDYLREYDMSLFNELDFEDVRDTLSETGAAYDPVGLEFTPYHVIDSVSTNSAFTTSKADVYSGQNTEGFYYCYKPLEDEQGFESEPFAVFRNYESTTDYGQVVIVCERDAGETVVPGTVVGSILDDGTVSINYRFNAVCRVVCFFEIADRGVLPVGKPNAYRTLYGISLPEVD